MASSLIGKRAPYSTRSVSTSEPVVSVDWLHANLREPDVKVVFIEVKDPSQFLFLNVLWSYCFFSFILIHMIYN